MFYEHNQVEDLLNCRSCNERYNTPLLLPCWKTLCQSCVLSKTDESTKLLACPYCKNTHEVPATGFPLNESLTALLKLRPVDVHRAEMYRTLGDLLKKLQLDMDDLSCMESHSHKNLLDYFDLITSEIKLSAKTLIQQVVRYRDKLLKEIDYFRAQSFESVNDLFASRKYAEFKRDCAAKKLEWQLIITDTSSASNPSTGKIS